MRLVDSYYYTRVITLQSCLVLLPYHSFGFPRLLYQGLQALVTLLLEATTFVAVERQLN